MKKTIKKRAFVSAIAMLIVSAIVLTSSTFAWFSMSKEATVEKMDLTVSSPEGIQISANASAWTASLTNDDFFNAESTSRYKAYDGNVNLMPLNLIPVSCAFRNTYDFDSDTGFAKFFKAVLNDQNTATITAVEQKIEKVNDAGLVAFDIFFKVAEDTTVYFGTSEITDNSSSDILTALRVAFSTLGNTASTDAATAIALKSASGTNTVLYEPDAENRSADAISADPDVIKNQRYIVSAGSGVSVNTDFVVEQTNRTAVTGAKVVKNTAAAANKSFSLKAGVTKMRIYIWVEGNDVDCRNSVAGATLSVALKFKID